MNCKNCKKNLSTQTKFCNECGAEVIEERITLKSLIAEVFANAFGWDNKYFVTVKKLIVSPQVIFQEYINGTRKKYVNPFAFFAIGAAISLLIFNQFSEDYLNLNKEVNKKQMETINDVMIPEDINANKNTSNTTKILDQEELLKEQLEQGEKIQKTILKYYNLFSFLLLPIYTLIAFLTFWKPYNYGEHLVINAYIQGITFLFTTFFFLLSLAINPAVHFFGLASTIVYYTYSYTRLYNLSFGKVILMLLKFTVITVIMLFILIVVSAVVGFVFRESLV